MKEQQDINKNNIIPVHSEMAGIIIGKLFDKAISDFRKHKVNIPLNKNQCIPCKNMKFMTIMKSYIRENASDIG